jgi:amino acid transporter
LVAALNGSQLCAQLNVVALLMANILLIVAWRHQQYRRRGERRPFWLGFQIFGWAAVVVMLDLFHSQYPVMIWLVNVLEPVRQVWLDSSSYRIAPPGSLTRLRFWWTGEISLLITLTTVLLSLQLLAAFLGGWLVRRAGLPPDLRSRTQ